MRSAWLLALALGLGSMSAAASPPQWQLASELDVRPLAEDQRQALRQRLKGALVRYPLENGEWHLHSGDLKIEGSFDNDLSLVVEGSVHISGSYDDHRSNLGHLVVLGDLYAEHVLSWGALYVQGALHARGVVFAYYNDESFEVAGRVHAAGLVIDDKATEYLAGRLGFLLEDRRSASAAMSAEALRWLEPELFTQGDALQWFEGEPFEALRPSYQVAVERVHAGKPLLRPEPAPPTLVEQVREVTAETPDVDRLRELVVGGDRLLAQLVASRGDLPTSVREALAASSDPVVQHWLRTQR
jgi:hypothetical protein